VPADAVTALADLLLGSAASGGGAVEEDAMTWPSTQFRC
jgi:hypothetical protein